MTVLVVALAGWLVLNVLALVGACVRASAAPVQSAESRSPATGYRRSAAGLSTTATATSG